MNRLVDMAPTGELDEALVGQGRRRVVWKVAERSIVVLCEQEQLWEVCVVVQATVASV